MTRFEIEEVTAWRIITEDGYPVSLLFDDYDDAVNELEAYKEAEDYEESARNERW